MKYLICYDIRSPKRLKKVHKVITQYAISVQLSVYWADLDKQNLKQMITLLEKVIDNKVDDIRIYATGSLLSADIIGQPNCPKQLFIS